MKLLILGGSRFVGRDLTEEALARGHEVTLFNRGQHNPDLFPDAEKLVGDRDGNLSALEGRRWDAVIDTSGYVPRIVRQSVELLADASEHYTFISTISVYAQPVASGADETAPLETVEDETTENISEAYGALKVLCERAVEAAFAGRSLIIRPGLIIGPHDYTDRFPYWVDRMARGGEVLAPGDPERQVQFVDGRDLAAWTLAMVEARQTGTYNATGPAYRLTMRETLEACRRGTGGDARLTWVNDAFLREHEVGVFMEAPFWLPQEDNGILEVSVERATQAGLIFRPMEETARDIHAWLQTRESQSLPWRGVAQGEKPRVGMTAEREADLLRQWHEQRRSEARA